MRSLLYRRVLSDRRSLLGSPSTGGRTGEDPHQRVEERGGDPHQRVEERGGGGSSSTGGRMGGADPHERDPHQVLEMVFCSSEMDIEE